jgi:hypothetical protein
MFVVRQGRIVEIQEIRNWDGVLLEKKEFDLGTREDALAAVDRQKAAVSEEKNRILSAQDGERSIPHQSEPFAKKDYFYTLGNYVYKCHCEYGQDGNLGSCVSERMGLKENILQEYDSILASLDARYQEILNASVEE